MGYTFKADIDPRISTVESQGEGAIQILPPLPRSENGARLGNFPHFYFSHFYRLF